MGTKLYVGGLSFNTTEDSLSDAFGQAGAVVSVAIIKDKLTGKSRGFGVVEMGDATGAEAAIAMWNGVEFEGRTLTVNEARPLEDRPPRRGGSGGFGGSGGSGGGGYNRHGGGSDYGGGGRSRSGGSNW